MAMYGSLQITLIHREHSFSMLVASMCIIFLRRSVFIQNRLVAICRSVASPTTTDAVRTIGLSLAKSGLNRAWISALARAFVGLSKHPSEIESTSINSTPVMRFLRIAAVAIIAFFTPLPSSAILLVWRVIDGIS